MKITDSQSKIIEIYFWFSSFTDIGLAVRVFANGPGDLSSIPGRVIPKTQKMVLNASLLNTQHYKVRIKGKVEQSREGVVPSPTPWCSSYRKGSLRVTLDYGRQLYFSFTETIVAWRLSSWEINSSVLVLNENIRILHSVNELWQKHESTFPPNGQADSTL